MQKLTNLAEVGSLPHKMPKKTDKCRGPRRK